MKTGALTAIVRKKFGKKGFTKGGDIKIPVLEKLKKSPSPITRKRANFALNIRRRK